MFNVKNIFKHTFKNIYIYKWKILYVLLDLTVFEGKWYVTLKDFLIFSKCFIPSLLKPNIASKVI